jgi:hypothetical protein
MGGMQGHARKSMTKSMHMLATGLPALCLSSCVPSIMQRHASPWRGHASLFLLPYMPRMPHLHAPLQMCMPFLVFDMRASRMGLHDETPWRRRPIAEPGKDGDGSVSMGVARAFDGRRQSRERSRWRPMSSYWWVDGSAPERRTPIRRG